jgi:hypothetical protein
MSTTTTTSRANESAKVNRMNAPRIKNRPTGVGRLVRRLERERKCWIRPAEAEIPTAQAWRAGVAEGIRLAQVAIRKGV